MLGAGTALAMILRPKPRGAVNPVSVIIILALIGLGWWLYTFLPVYWDNLSVREAAGAAAIDWLRGEESVKATVMRRLNMATPEGVVGWHFATDEEGNETKVPGLGVAEEDITVNWDEASRTVTIRISYDRVVEMKPLDKRRTVHFEVEKKTKLQ